MGTVRRFVSPLKSTLLSRTPMLNRLGPQAPLILEIDLDRGVLSQAPDNPLAAMRTLNAASMRALRDGLRQAARDDAVKGLIVHIGTCPLSRSQHDEIGDLIEQFGTVKPTIAYSETFGELGNAVLAYRLATRAQQIWLQPSGGIGLFGMHLDITLLRGGLAKLGVDVQISKRHEYKTAADQFSASEVSDANRAMMTRIAESIMADSVRTIARRRDLTEQQVWDAVNAAPLTAQQALDGGFVDHIGYRDQVYAGARTDWQVPVAKDAAPGDSLRFAHRFGQQSDGPLSEVLGKLRPGNDHGPKISVVGVHGGIVAGHAADSPATGRAISGIICDQLRAAERDESVRAVVVRVDSPGGSYVASDTIWRAVHQLRDAGKPVVASMGDLAASGGYFVAMAATEIVANPSTLTGSIGVFGGKAVTRELVAKLGLVQESVGVGARSGMMHGDDEFTDDEWAVLNQWLDQVYADFTSKAAADRGLPLEVLEPLARGRVWTGTDAHQRKLVDHLGGMDTAIERACVLAGLDRDRTELWSVSRGPLLARFRPSSSSESVMPGVGAPGLDSALSHLLGRLTSPGIVDAALDAVLPVGVLTCPYAFRLH